MELKDQIKQLGDRILKLKGEVKTEEATKSAFVMPFIQMLGFDLFNPTEVVPEFITDYGARNVEKVDYAIMKDGQPVLIIECKHHLENVEKHYTQVHKYFHLTKCRFAVLTNGINYNFYADIDATNKMDEKPFLSFDITTIKESQIKELLKFHKSVFDVNSILTTASELKYSNEIKNVFIGEMSNPSSEFVKYLVGKVYDGRLTEKVLTQFTEIVKKTIDQTFNEIISDRLMGAINQTKQAITETVIETPVEEDNKIITTEEELNSFYIVKSILRTKVDSNRISYRDAQSYFSINLDDNNRKPICRLWFNNSKKYIGTFDGEKKETKHEITGLDDIYKFSNELLTTIDYYVNEK